MKGVLLFPGHTAPRNKYTQSTMSLLFQNSTWQPQSSGLVGGKEEDEGYLRSLEMFVQRFEPPLLPTPTPTPSSPVQLQMLNDSNLFLDSFISQPSFFFLDEQLLS